MANLYQQSNGRIYTYVISDEQQKTGYSLEKPAKKDKKEENKKKNK